MAAPKAYNRGRAHDDDLIVGPDHARNWTGFHPIIAEFVSDDDAAIEGRKARIPDAEWQRAYRLGKAYLKQRPGVWRDGRPVHASMPGPA